LAITNFGNSPRSPLRICPGEKNQPVTNVLQPVTNALQPVTNALQPVTNALQPVLNTRQPVTNGSGFKTKTAILSTICINSMRV
jgi:hypothetical protein